MDTFIKNFASSVGNVVTVRGWLHNKRSSGAIIFLEIRDGSGFVQAIVAKQHVAPLVWEAAEQLTQESSLELTGTVSPHPKHAQLYELQVSSLIPIQIAEEYPIAKKEHGPDFLMDYRHLWLRSKRQWAILRLRDVIETAMHDYMHRELFIRTDSPIFTPNACEGTTTLFPVEYFDEGTAYLAQTGQLYIEAAIASVGRCYDFGPVFRNEKSKTKRHLAEFWMMDAEAAFVEHDENLRLQEGLVKFIVSSCMERCQEEFKLLERNPEPLRAIVEKPFTRLSYDETILRLRELGSDIKDGEDLGNDDEARLTKESDVPIFVEKWPKAIKSFYMKVDGIRPDRVLNADLIATEGAGEIIGGSQREENIDILLERIRHEGLPEKEYAWYLDTRRFGAVPHSGFGIGLERMVRWMAGVEHIRECIPFPRTITRLRP